MKTKPTEALKIIDENWDKGGTSYDLKMADMIACNVAFKEGQSNPKIKQLEWEKGDGEYWEAITPIGTYSITFDSGVYVALYDMDDAVDGEWKSLAKAKIACNSDFERRVKECLE